MNRIERMRLALGELAPVDLEIVDESHLHAGHAGARSGRGHYRVRMVSARFDGMNAIARHRAVYAVLGSLMQTDIHALTLETLSPAEAGGSVPRPHSTA